MEITFLGTSSMVPTKERNHTSIYIDVGQKSFLFDCGEGTQRQLTLANLKANKITHIFISHWHGDHVLGLPGLIQTLASRNYEGKLTVYGPKSTKERFKNMFNTFVFDKSIEIDIIEVSDNMQIYEDSDLIVKSYSLKHTIDTFGYVIIEKDKRRMIKSKLSQFNLSGELIGKLQNNQTITYNNKKITPDDVSYIEKGKKLTMIFDTTLCENLLKMSMDSDLLIAESTYLDELSEKAQEYGHLTAIQAAQIASQSNSKQLILTHFSSRYKQLNDILDEARKIFKNTLVAHDLMKIKI